jgi:hypothetical protein
VAAFGVAASSALAFVLVEGRVDQSMIDVGHFRRREFTGGIVALMLWAFGLFGIHFFTSLYLRRDHRQRGHRVLVHQRQRPAERSPRPHGHQPHGHRVLHQHVTLLLTPATTGGR